MKYLKYMNNMSMDNITNIPYRKQKHKPDRPFTLKYSVSGCTVNKIYIVLKMTNDIALFMVLVPHFF